MLWSQLSLQTFREDNHPLLVRAGYLRDGEFALLGQRSLAKIEAVLSQENDRGRARLRALAGHRQGRQSFDLIHASTCRSRISSGTVPVFRTTL
jgi:hypothetical protein